MQKKIMAFLIDCVIALAIFLPTNLFLKFLVEITLVPYDTVPDALRPDNTMRKINDFFEAGFGSYLSTIILILILGFCVVFPWIKKNKFTFGKIVMGLDKK